ncbi:hypothetical protein SNE40_015546 [Patella caerulea]|uniref:G-protein coupled receptors family 1 profile domain-containing protein n=1 Tax=Patella caerulea TaxID=87958 RepID=A0AAN8PJE7_PATCE
MVAPTFKTIREISMMMPEFSDVMDSLSRENLSISAFLGLICTLGILGNSTVIIIYVNLKKKTPSIYFILSLAVSDFLICTLVLPTCIALRFIEIPLEYSYICKITLWYSYAFVGLSCLFLLIIAVDRYLAVCKTHKLRLNNRWALIMSLSAVATAFTIALLPALHSSVFIKMRINNQTYTIYPERCHITRLVSNPLREFDDRLTTHLTLFIMYVIMIISISVLYIVVFSTLRKREANWKMWNNAIHPGAAAPAAAAAAVAEAEAEPMPVITISGGTTGPLTLPQVGPTSSRQGNTSSNFFDLSSSNKLSTVISRRLFLVTLIYILTWMPFYLIEFNLLSYQEILHNIFFISNMINPIIYPATSKVFRSQFKKICCARCIKKKGSGM